MRRPISSINPLFYTLIVGVRCSARRLKWWFGGQKFAKTISYNKLPYRVYKHQSVLIRKLGVSDLSLQYNKATNLKLALKKINGLLIRPQETFSYCYLTGKPSKRKGYLNGMMLSNGEAKAGIGGGICQIANLIHWLCLHSPLTVTERHHHSYDPFPDEGRVVPFGSGATILYNYLDYQFINNTPYTFQLMFWLDDKCINGDLRIDEELPYKYHVFEQNHRFLKIEETFYRENELWRKKIKKLGNGEILETELLQKNFSQVKYTPEHYTIINNT
ncbi:MAG: VanW family protein [Firmicutes bacterium]|nr:VanW family protein [Bacillota bacterium]